MAEAVAEGDVVPVLLPDSGSAPRSATEIAFNLKEGAAFAHGFNIRYGY